MAAVAGRGGGRSSGEGVSRATEGADRRQGPIARILIALLLMPLRFYRRAISPLLGPRCRYYPTCSAYAEQAIGELGPLRGTIVAGWRVLRCNPLSDGGIDPLSERRLFRGRDHPADRSASRSSGAEEVPSR